MSQGNLNYPFSATHGMDDAKSAILCALTNDDIRTVLIRGGTGSGKTLLSRSVQSIDDRALVNIPINVSYEQLFGGLDVDVAMREGRLSLRKGLMHRADGNVIYVDDINLMDQTLLLSLLDSVTDGVVRVETAGVSAMYACETTLIASMNPEQTDISSHILDRFDICAYSESRPSADDRRRVLMDNERYIEDRQTFVEYKREDDSGYTEMMERGRRILPLVTVSDELVELCVELSSHVGAHGYRGDLSTIRTARTLASLEYRDEVTRTDVERAAKLCLVHRRDYSKPPPPPESPSENEERDEERPPRDKEEPTDERERDPGDGKDAPSEDVSQMLQDLLFGIGEEFRVTDYLKGPRRRIRHTSSRNGRRDIAESRDSTGRYVRSRVPKGRVRDVAFDATIRAAAPYQRTRDHRGLAFTIEGHDIRQKVRERRSGCTIMFLVDASGSLGVRKRMTAVKGAVMSMLKDSYVKRDRIGLMEFRRDSAEVILPPTRSVEYGFRLLEELPTGGRTPLGKALLTASDYMGSYSRSHVGERCYVVLITDGHANVSLAPGVDAAEEARRLASRIHVPDLGWIVIDASARYSTINDAELLAAELGATYLRLRQLDADQITENVRNIVR